MPSTDLFEQAFARLMRIEDPEFERTGHLSYYCHSTDRGGWTFAGIARKHHPDWPGWAVIDENPADPDEVRLLPMVLDFYRAEYWDSNRCGDMAASCPRAAVFVFIQTINFGAVRVRKDVQRSAGGCKVDGLIGPNTLVRVAQRGDEAMLHALEIASLKRYHRMSADQGADDPDLKNLRGWESRVRQAAAPLE